MTTAKSFAGYAVSVVILSSFLVVAPAAGQQGGQTGSTGSSRPRPRPTTPRLPEEKRPLLLSGRVVMDDGASLGKRAAIERVCNGRVMRETYTDSHGYFSFWLGSNMEHFQDASVAGRGFDFGTGSGMDAVNAGLGNPAGANSGVSARDLLSCEVRASLPGYISDNVPLAGLHVSDNADIGTIVLHHMGKVEGTRVSVSSLKAPKDAKKAFHRGVELLEKKKTVEATEQLTKAVKLYPDYAEALSRLGDIATAEGRPEEADKFYRQALAIDGRFMAPYFGLVVLAGARHDWQGMAQLSSKALALDPYEYPALYFYDSVANYNLRNMARAEKSAREAQRLDSQHRIPKIEFLLGNILLLRDDYSGAAEQLRVFLKYAPAGAEADTARRLLGDTESKLSAASSPAPKQQ